jgi:hypothetical protein
MIVKCLRCQAENELDEGVNMENVYCSSCFAPLSESHSGQLAETVEHNNREIEKLKGATVSYGRPGNRTD